MRNGLSDTQCATLRTLCDSFFPSIERADDAAGFWQRRASAIGVDVALAATIGSQAGIGQLLDAVAAHGFEATEQSSPQAKASLAALCRLALLLAYALPDDSGRNPNWAVFGYPGPSSAAPPQEGRITPFAPLADRTALDADVCVVGSGAGGGVVAGTLASQGLRVVVLEGGDYFTAADFPQLELWAAQRLFWRGGLASTVEGNVSLLAGANLGGGTTVNYMNCVPTPERVLRRWHADFDLPLEDFSTHLAAVLERISANDRCSDLNGPHQKLALGVERLGYAFKTALRNVDPARYEPESAGYVGFGDRSGSRQCATRTFLQDAFDHGASIVSRCNARRLLLEHGRAAGVEAVSTDANGRRIQVTVRAPHVVVACGALETPALLLRSAIGGSQVGRHLHLHPTIPVVGVYDEQLQPWWGPPQAAMSDEFSELRNASGFVIEGTHFAPGLFSAAASAKSPAEHKAFMAELGSAAVFIAILGDQGSGSVMLDECGEPRVHYLLDDARDVAGLRRALAELSRIHHAAGAREIHRLAPGVAPWRRGDDFDVFLRRVEEAPLGAAGDPLFSAHQMGSARMGADPSTSVARPSGELHDTPGVWIADTSAFPTALGTNPMVTCMALARHTASAILAEADARNLKVG